VRSVFRGDGRVNELRLHLTTSSNLAPLAAGCDPCATCRTFTATIDGRVHSGGGRSTAALAKARTSVWSRRRPFHIHIQRHSFANRATRRSTSPSAKEPCARTTTRRAPQPSRRSAYGDSRIRLDEDRVMRSARVLRRHRRSANARFLVGRPPHRHGQRVSAERESSFERLPLSKRWPLSATSASTASASSCAHRPIAALAAARTTP